MDFFDSEIIESLDKVVNGEFVDCSMLSKMQLSGLIEKITFNQYVITEKGFKILNNNKN